MENPKKLICYKCKEIVKRPKSHLKYKTIYCSRKCYLDTIRNNPFKASNYKNVNIDYKCKNCGLDFKRRPHKNIPKYCSMECAAKHRSIKQSGKNHWNWKGGNDTRYIKKHTPRPRPDLCEICNSVGGKRNGIVLDHNHKTKKFRGWICSNCNTIIGLAHENVSKLKSIISYINENSL